MSGFGPDLFFEFNSNFFMELFKVIFFSFTFIPVQYIRPDPDPATEMNADPDPQPCSPNTYTKALGAYAKLSYFTF